MVEEEEEEEGRQQKEGRNVEEGRSFEAEGAEQDGDNGDESFTDPPDPEELIQAIQGLEETATSDAKVRYWRQNLTDYQCLIYVKGCVTFLGIEKKPCRLFKAVLWILIRIQSFGIPWIQIRKENRILRP